MSRTRPERVPDVSSKCPCPDQFGTSPNRTSATKAAVTTPGDEDEGGRNKLTLPTSDHPGNQDSYSSVSEDYPEPPDHASPGKFCQCGVYGCLERDCTNWNGVYEPVDRAIVSEYSSKEDPEDFGFYWFIGGLFDSAGSDKNDETGDEGVSNARTKPKVEYNKEEDTNMYLNLQAGCWTYQGLCWTEYQNRKLMWTLRKLPQFLLSHIVPNFRFLSYINCVAWYYSPY